MLTYNPPTKEPLERDVMFDEVVKLVQATGLASASLIQRHLKLGYARSARLLDDLETAGIIGPGQGAKPRVILIPHNDQKGEFITPPPKTEPIKEEKPKLSWKKTKYADNKPDQFEVDLGFDENKKSINLNLERYGNLLVIGSQFTSAINLLNNILATSMARYSPNELRIIAIDGNQGDLIIPNDAPHLLTSLIVNPEMSVSALKWSISEIERRRNQEDEEEYPKVLIFINSLNQILCFAPAEVEDSIYRIIAQGRKYGFYFVIGTDYPNTRTSKEIVANSPAKIVFKPTDKKVARDTGIPESAELSHPDQAILETMYEDKVQLTISHLDPKKIYEEIFE